MTEFGSRNQRALATLVDEHGVQLRRFPDEVLATLREHTVAVMDDLARSDATIARVYDSYRSYARAIGAWTLIAEGAYSGIRRL